jgi:hypothetical protein
MIVTATSRVEDRFEELRTSLQKFQRRLPLRPGLMTHLEDQLDESLRFLKAAAPEPFDFSSPSVVDHFTKLADVCQRIVFADQPKIDPSTGRTESEQTRLTALKQELEDANQQIVDFFSYYGFPINLESPALGSEDSYLDDPGLFLEKVEYKPKRGS